MKQSDHELITVYSSVDPVMASIAASYLEAQEIPCMTKNQDLQNLVGAGMIGGFNLVAGPIEILVPTNYARRAAAILKDLEETQNSATGLPVETKISMRRIATHIVALVFAFLVISNIVTIIFFPGTLLIVVPISALLACCIPGLLYLRHLRTLGYEWPTIGDANRIIWCRWRDAYTMPPAADVELIPGFRRDSEHIIQFMMNLQDYKRDTRRKH